jgi:hypothetical protein
MYSPQWCVLILNVVLQVPDLLLDEYESLSREGKIANTYEAGQLNIIRYWSRPIAERK